MNTVTVELQIPDDLPFDLFVTAIEGGINYWFDVRAYRWMDDHKNDNLFGFYAKGYTWEDTHLEREMKMIDRETMLKGIGLILSLSDEELSLHGKYRDRIRNCVAAGGVDKVPDYDADDADHVVQVGMFGKVIYG